MMAGPEEPEHATKRAKTCAAAEESAPSIAGDGSTAHPGGPEMQAAAAAAAGGGGREDPRASAFAARPIPRRRGPRPKSGDYSEDMKRWFRDGEEIMNDYLKDPSTFLPTNNSPGDFESADGVVSTEHKRVVCDAARSIVCVSSSFGVTGKEKNLDFTGIVVAWDETNARGRILTTSRIVCDKNGALRDPIPELSIHFPNKTVTEGQLLFFNDHYSIALLEIRADFPMQLPSFGSSPSYGQKVFVLTRCIFGSVSLMAMHRQILWAENSDYLHHGHYFLLSEQLSEYCTGGAVVDHDGKIIGMLFDQSQKAMICISIVLTCIKMWTKFSRIARPMIGMSFRTVELQDVAELEETSHYYNIKDGFIVHGVSFDSIAERLGFRKCDVVVSFNGRRFSTLSQLEDFLLNLGWEFLESSADSSSMVNLELDVHDLVRRDRLNITLPLGFSDASEREVEVYKE